MKYLKTLLVLFVISIVAIVITGILLNYLGIKHGPLLIKIGITFLTVNIVLYLLILIAFVVRNLISIYNEKRQKVMVSRFRRKLVAAFVGLTLIPSIFLFILSKQLIDNTIDKWFSIEIQSPINDSMDIAKTFYLREARNIQTYADLLASSKNVKTPMNGERRGVKAYLLRHSDGSDLVSAAFKGIPDTEIITSDSGDIIRAASPVKEGNEVAGVVVVETTISKDIVNKMGSIKKSYNEYHQIKTLQNPIKFIYFLILAIATLLIVFLALWIALRIAKGITVPIRLLAEATTHVADGNLDTAIDLKRDDEIGLLINSFNRMVRELKEGRISLQESYTESDRRRLSMEAILENINTGVIFLEHSGRIITLNKAACTMLNLSRNNLIGKRYKELLEKIKSEELNSMINQIGKKGFNAAQKEIHAAIDGNYVNLRVYITTLKDSADNFIGILVVFDDLTKIIKAQRVLAWEEVARRVAHEIKNPLTPIKLSAERVMKKWQEKTPDFETVLKGSITTIVREVDSLKGLVDEFTRFGKMPKIKLAPNNLKTIVEDVVNLYSDFKQIKILTSFGDIPEIEIDREQIKRVLINLIDNSIQAKTENIWLNIFYDPFLELVRIEVIDDGLGIKEEDRDKLFLPYFSTKKEGTGLGMAIVNKIITDHNGYISVRGNEPKGTQFIIELPASRK
ncbi:MAG: HAMP domain-containing protein [Nitrospirae bacterium]|nr:HAMP domain-containing protein [Nitrospirota bacterium]